MVTVHIAAVIVGLLGAALLGVLAGSLGASGKGGDQLADALDRAALLEQEAAFHKGSRNTWKATAEELRGQRDDAEKAVERATTALSWLVDETPGLDAALEFPPDAADIIKRVETLREDLGRQGSTSAWRDFAGEREFEDVW